MARLVSGHWVAWVWRALVCPNEVQDRVISRAAVEDWGSLDRKWKTTLDSPSPVLGSSEGDDLAVEEPSRPPHQSTWSSVASRSLARGLGLVYSCSPRILARPRAEYTSPAWHGNASVLVGQNIREDQVAGIRLGSDKKFARLVSQPSRDGQGIFWLANILTMYYDVDRIVLIIR
jgi:hypothetical protein